MPNRQLRLAKLTFAEKGLLSYISSHHSDHDLTMKQIEAETADGRDAVRRLVKSLEDKGYLIRTPRMDSKTGRPRGFDWQVMDPNGSVSFEDGCGISAPSLTSNNVSLPSSLRVRRSRTLADQAQREFSQVVEGAGFQSPKKTEVQEDKEEEGPAAPPRSLEAVGTDTKRPTGADSNPSAKPSSYVPRIDVSRWDLEKLDFESLRGVLSREWEEVEHLVRSFAPVGTHDRLLRWARSYTGDNRFFEVFLVCWDLSRSGYSSAKAAEISISKLAEGGRRLEVPLRAQCPGVDAVKETREVFYRARVVYRRRVEDERLRLAMAA